MSESVSKKKKVKPIETHESSDVLLRGSTSEIETPKAKGTDGNESKGSDAGESGDMLISKDIEKEKEKEKAKEKEKKAKGKAKEEDENEIPLQDISNKPNLFEEEDPQPTTKLPQTKSVTILPKEAVSKEGDLMLKEGLVFKKYFFKSWKDVHVSLTKDRCVIAKVGGDPKPKGDFSLSQCYVTYIAGGPSEERLQSFLVHTAKAEQFVLKASSASIAKDWITAFKANSKILDTDLLATLQFPNVSGEPQEKALKMGWVKEKSATGSWKWKYLVMTEYSLYLYDKAPQNSSQLSSYSSKFTLCECQQREVNPSELPNSEEDNVKFVFLIISQKDPISIATETRNELRNWLNALKTTTMTAIKKIETWNFDVTFEEKPTIISISRSSGFTLKSETGDVETHPLSHFKQFKIGRNSVGLDFGKFSPKIIEVQTPESDTISILISLILESLMDPTRLKV